MQLECRSAGILQKLWGTHFQQNYTTQLFTKKAMKNRPPGFHAAALTGFTSAQESMQVPLSHFQCLRGFAEMEYHL